ncbi:MAG: acetyl-CoA carboxylase carboxyltransferase subunit alpha [Kiritimatiellae bacterium]|nr:acetyl-CoA carboxylase carboxyltransferase subunit alpha [Kiritimatiellia bacterium]NLD89394.1 acetyl-CoA carboxylase carboxyltransferase subunit alpha [Lentisphaerota bacterium]HPC19115.1 acetyl-CoA carboxylase carboxyltransferase subunit alpha [Kiritimatiellia bacterium]HQN81075.1 acetyl-CoA carboxylase carboxyltransferase subunit alpha [Kiritimatiellia bacterium]
MAAYILPFEKPLLDLQNKIDELRAFSQGQGIAAPQDVARLEKELAETRRNLYATLTPWQKVMVARHPRRPYTRDYIAALFSGFSELHGDRLLADDQSIVGGLGWLGEQQIMVIGTQKGRDTKSNLACNFGCPFPEGYRKALRLMRLAAKFNIPIVTFIDTPGAFPGIEGEQRHVAEAIAVNLREMFRLPVPILAIVIGEGGSGGALGIGIANRILILEYAYYSVISPEGCAAILWKNRAHADTAAAALKLTAPDLVELGIADELIPEPPGGAHTDPAAATALVRDALVKNLAQLKKLPPRQLLDQRYDKFRVLGIYKEGPVPPLTPPPVPLESD